MLRDIMAVPAVIAVLSAGAANGRWASEKSLINKCINGDVLKGNKTLKSSWT